MTVLTRFFRPALLSLILASPSTAMAAVQDDLLAALAAYNRNDTASLAQITASMPANPLRIYPAYWLTLKALEQQNDDQVSQFLAQNGPSILTEKVRQEWVKQLGRNQRWALFATQWAQLPVEGRDEESRCYGDLLAMRQGGTQIDFSRFLVSKALPDGCNTLINTAAASGLISQDWLWQRLRLLLAGNFLTQAKLLANSNDLPFDASKLNTPVSSLNLSSRQRQEILLYTIGIKAKTSLPLAAQLLASHADALGPANAGFAWGQLAMLSARKLQMDQALDWYAQSDRSQLSNEQWEWWARATLRQGQWAALQSVIQAMPPTLSSKPVWQYWLGRSLATQGQTAQANALYARTSTDRSYYGLLSLEELGNSINSQPEKASPTEQDSTAMKKDPAVIRSLALFDIAESVRNPALRSAAQSEWRWAMRNRSDLQLLAAADIARKVGFYDMAIYSAERTKTLHDFSLRYLMPYHDITQRYAKQLGVDNAWVYGLIRQESRFITLARSGVGASGLMQLMPKTARWVAQKIGMGNTLAINDIETNIQLGTWYLKYVLDKLSDNEVLATAAYNAGPGRAKAWEAAVPLEGTVYAETIPFGETRDYVQKVMANAAWYASVMGHTGVHLKTRMSTVPAKAN